MTTHLFRGALAALLLCCLAAAAPSHAGEAEWLAHLERGKNALDAGNADEAREALILAEQEAAGTFAMTDPRAVDTTRLLAEANRLSDRVAVAEDLHRQLLGVLSLDLGDKDPATIAQQVELARFYAKVPDFQKARDAYARALASQKEDRASFPDWPAVAYEQAIVLFRLRDYKAADELLTEAMPAVRRQFGADSLAAATLARALGEVKIALNDDEAAGPFLQESLDIYTRSDGDHATAVTTIRLRQEEIAKRRDARLAREAAAAAATAAREEAAAAPTAPAVAVTPEWTSLPIPEGWRSVTIFHGSEPTTSRPFNIEGRRWRLVWRTHATGDPRFASLGVTLFRDGESFAAEHVDVAGSATDFAEYLGPGRFHLRFNTANVTYQVAVIESTQVPPPNPLERPAEAGESADQKALEELINSYSVRYRTATNDLQRSSIRARRAKDITALMPENHAVLGWTGIVKGHGTASDGSITLSIQLDGSRRITVATRLLPEADKDTRTLIPADSPLATVVQSLKEGDRVTFAGFFLPDVTGPDGILELSTTENASMTSPEFLMRFRLVQRQP